MHHHVHAAVFRQFGKGDLRKALSTEYGHAAGRLDRVHLGKDRQCAAHISLLHLRLGLHCGGRDLRFGRGMLRCDFVCRIVLHSLLLFCLPVIAAVDEIDDHIGRNDHEIDDVHDQHIAEIAAQDLRGDPRDIACDDEQDELQTHRLGAARLNVFIHGQRPRAAEANKHHCFQNIRHFQFLLFLFRYSPGCGAYDTLDFE